MKGNENSKDEHKEKEGESKNADLSEMENNEDLSKLKEEMPLDEGVLKVNLGIPVIVVCHKIDLMMRGEKVEFLEKNIDFIQRHLRNYCLAYAASLIFTESMQQTNIEKLYRYLLHRLYN
jgi:hypothetical protein